ncbi:hypothetical protein RYX36_024613 [Vicia faba]
MAKKSVIEREKKRKKLEQKYHLIRRSPKKEMSKAQSLSEKWEIQGKLEVLPRNSAPTRLHRCCFETGRPRAPIRKGPEKLSSYESGIEPMGDAWLQFQIRYYMFAIVFLVFDVETVFLYPWAMSFDVLGVSVFIEAFIFVLILIVGLVYAWRKGALEWS